jgi:hypothetical protein
LSKNSGAGFLGGVRGEYRSMSWPTQTERIDNVIVPAVWERE